MYKLEVNINNQTRTLNHFFTEELANIQLYNYILQFRRQGYIVSVDNFTILKEI